MNRRKFLTKMGGLASLATGAYLGTRFGFNLMSKKERPNILIFSVDTLNCNLGYMGYSRNTSPHIDAFSKKCIRFDHAISPSTWTVPSYISLVTGKYPPATLNIRNRLPFSEVTFPKILQEEGYRTHFFGEEYSLLTEDTGILQGFDRIQIAKNRWNKSRYKKATEEILRSLKDEKDNLFLFYTNDCHSPYQAIEPPKNPFLSDGLFVDITKVPISKETFPETNIPVWWGGIRDDATIDGIPQEVGVYQAQYDAGIRSVDRQFGEMMKALKEEGSLENTIVILHSDHGEVMFRNASRKDQKNTPPNADIFFQHRNPFERCIRVPLLMYIPDSKPQVVKTTVQSLDIMPTILDIAKIPTPSDIDGENLYSFVRGEKKEIREGYAFAYDESVSVITQGDFKLIRSRCKSFAHCLYNLKDDPKEKTNLWNDPSSTEIRERLITKINKKTKDLYSKGKRIPFENRELDSEDLERIKSLGYL